MKRTLFAGLACLSALTLSVPAHAAANLTSVTVTGEVPANGTVWDTVANGFYTVFVAQPFGNVINGGANPTVSNATEDGINSFSLIGEGYFDSDRVDSNIVYRLTLGFANGASLTGLYDSATDTFLSGSTADVGGTVYSLVGFSWDRIPGFDQAGAFTLGASGDVGGNDESDYLGGFSFTAVPEPSTWAMMIGGFALLGGIMRRRRRPIVTFA